MTDERHRQREIVVGLDGSPQSAHALDTAIDLAAALDARITAVYAIPPPTPAEYGAGYAPPVPPAEFDPEWRAEMTREFKQEWCRPLQTTGIAYSTVVEDGRPASVVAGVAERLNTDFVVVGRRGRSAVAEFVLGSVSHELSHHCLRPVLLVSGKATPKSTSEVAAVGSRDG